VKDASPVEVCNIGNVWKLVAEAGRNKKLAALKLSTVREDHLEQLAAADRF
jgi:hypothetical protein